MIYIGPVLAAGTVFLLLIGERIAIRRHARKGAS
ncbi:hypothetical protein SMD44_00996 [Streptomyces alboflavus]|uniref:Uncharacterized protein n=1 Tax=Streptomyces alboflavus TaxID=67267 RepID=A0A1Z1W589_9ACTN|nr:hypothetical protein SMD44_00996 [Streptomyces alboflavus]